MDAEQLVGKLLQYVALVLALCVHECAHAASAKWLGDSTAEDEGRLTLSPIAHADPIGTVLLPVVAIFFSVPFLFGWARPVPFNPANFRPGWFGRGRILVAAAGPISNLLQALFWIAAFAVVARIPVTGDPTALILIAGFIQASVVINLILMAFNFIPLPPLDGGHVASWLLPRHLGEKYDEIVGSFGMLLFIALLVPIPGLSMSIISIWIRPAVKFGLLMMDLVSR